MNIEKVMCSIPYDEFTKLYETNNKLLEEKYNVVHILQNILKTKYDKKTVEKEYCAGMFDYYFVSSKDILYPLFKLYGFNIIETKEVEE